MTNLDLQTVIQRFAEADCSWLSTVRPDSRPHSAPVWHIWTGSLAYIVTKPSAVKVNNIRHCADVVLTHPDPHKAIIIEGQARIVLDKTNLLRPLFEAKYDWDIVADEEYNTIIEITPQKLLAWGEEGAGHRKRWTGEEVIASA
jgi:general stress protein 26